MTLRWPLIRLLPFIDLGGNLGQLTQPKITFVHRLLSNYIIHHHSAFASCCSSAWLRFLFFLFAFAPKYPQRVRPRQNQLNVTVPKRINYDERRCSLCEITTDHPPHSYCQWSANWPICAVTERANAGQCILSSEQRQLINNLFFSKSNASHTINLFVWSTRLGRRISWIYLWIRFMDG